METRSVSPSDASQDLDSEVVPWTQWFCHLIGHDYYIQVDDSFIEDEFNLTGLQQLIPYFNEALDMILDMEPEQPTTSETPPTQVLEKCAEALYALIHQRFLLTKAGLSLLAEKVEQAVYGTCPRVQCYQQPLIPFGPSLEYSISSVQLYCPRCQDLYQCRVHRYQRIDGAAFGPSVAPLLLLTYPELMGTPLNCPRVDENGRWRLHATRQVNVATRFDDDEEMTREQREEDRANRIKLFRESWASWDIYVPRIYGFRLHPQRGVGLTQAQVYLRGGVGTSTTAPTAASTTNLETNRMMTN